MVWLETRGVPEQKMGNGYFVPGWKSEVSFRLHWIKFSSVAARALQQILAPWSVVILFACAYMQCLCNTSIVHACSHEHMWGLAYLFVIMPDLVCICYVWVALYKHVCLYSCKYVCDCVWGWLHVQHICWTCVYVCVCCCVSQQLPDIKNVGDRIFSVYLNLGFWSAFLCMSFYFLWQN